MEFTVSKADLVRELSLSQGVVEKKTTIPILSNVLLEAEGDRIILTATDLELGIRCSCPAKVKKEGAGTIPARKLAGLCAAASGRRAERQVSGESLGEHYLRPIARRGWPGCRARVFRSCRRCRRRSSEIPVKLLASMISRTVFAISMEESRFTLNGALLLLRTKGMAMVATDGHRLAYVESSMSANGSSAKGVSRADAEEGHGRDCEAGGRERRGCQSCICGRRQSPVFPVRRAAADHAQADRKFSGLRACAAQGQHQHRHAATKTRSAPRSSVWRSSPTSVRAPFACSSARVKSRFSLRRSKPARAKRASPPSMRGRSSRLDSTRNTCWIFCAPSRRTKSRSR